MAHYYNEFDPFAAQWLRNLISAGLLPAGDVDDRSITEVTADELRGYTQCHFFAGIGGWPLALRMAGWADSRPVWTGSCPCQPFSTAGKGQGFADERHLWPEFYRLITQCKPGTVFGEQVAKSAGRAWLDTVSTDLEAIGYAVGAADLAAAGVGAPHIRQRMYWVADADSQGLERRRPGERTGKFAAWAGSVELRGRDGKFRPVEPESHPLAHGIPGRMGRLRAYGNAIVPPLAAEFIAAYMEYSPLMRAF